jgi:hypothetical protein
MRKEWRLEKTNKEKNEKEKAAQTEQKNQVMKEEERNEFKWGRLK